MIERILELFVIRVNSLAKRTQSYAERTQYRAEMRSNRLLAKQLAGADGFSYTQDYISDYISLWEEHLAPFKGKTGVAALEVGSYEGRSAVWLLENILTAPDALITCVDPLWGAGDEPLRP